MKQLLFSAWCLCLSSSDAKAAMITPLNSTAQVWHDSEEGDTAVFTFAWTLTSGADNLYANRLVGITGQSVPDQPAFYVSLSGIPTECLQVLYYVSYENVVALGPLNYLAAGRQTEVYLTVSVSSSVPGTLTASIGGFGFWIGSPLTPSQPIDLDSYETSELQDVSEPLTIVSIPEPSCVLSGLAGLVLGVRRRR